jgi:hypothetical protein
LRLLTGDRDDAERNAELIASSNDQAAIAPPCAGKSGLLWVNPEKSFLQVLRRQCTCSSCRLDAASPEHSSFEAFPFAIGSLPKPQYPFRHQIREKAMAVDDRPVDNGVNVEALLGAREAFSNAPEAGAGRHRGPCCSIAKAIGGL